MTTIVTRSGKGTSLSWIEADANFTNLNIDKLEKSNNLSELTNISIARANLNINNVDNTSDINKPVSTAQQTAINSAVSVHEAALVANTGATLVGFIQPDVGALARTVQDVLQQSKSVKDFGAVGDGITDDTAALQLAEALAATGVPIYFPKGIYLTTLPLVFTTPITLRADPKTRIKLTSAASAVITIDLTGAGSSFGYGCYLDNFIKLYQLLLQN